MSIEDLVMPRNILFIFSVFFLLLFTMRAEAVPLEIIDTPHYSGGFTPNVFHKSTSGGAMGKILGWFELDTSVTNIYDPFTGDISAVFKIYDNRNFSNVMGSVKVAGNIPAGNFGVVPSNAIAGTITYEFDFLFDNALSKYLNTDYTIDVVYRDRVYTTTQGRDVNGWEGDFLSLWGAGQIIYPNNVVRYLGTDLVIETGDHIIPEPASMFLFALGSGVFFIKRRFIA